MMPGSPYERHPYDRTAGVSPEPEADVEPRAGALPIEMFLLRPAIADDAGCLDQISEVVVALGGVVLMATGGGGIVVGMPPGCKDALTGAPPIGFVGGVSFAEDAPGLAALRQKFAMNAASQLAAQGRTWVGETPRPGSARPAIPVWGDRLVDPRTVLPPTAGPANTTKGARR